MPKAPIPTFDGHNDALLRLYMKGGDAAIPSFLEGGAGGHIDLPRARQGGLAGGLFAIFPPSAAMAGFMEQMQGEGYDLPLPDPLTLAEGQASTLAMAAIFFRIEAASGGAFAICRSVADIRAANARGALAAVLHIEGAEAIGSDLAMLDVLHAAGLRSIGPVWSRSNIFGHGVPMRFPSSPDTGPGLTDTGRALIRACNRLRVMIDLSHLNEKGFWEVAELSDAPLVASHSNVHAICPVSRNLTDRQFEAIRASGGVVGLNFATAFLRPDGHMDANTDIGVMIRHLDAMLERLGEKGVALGSDYDGAVVPSALSDVSHLPRLWDALSEHGYGDELIRRIAYENWLDVLDRTWSR
ncbi:dipeptidase [Kaistia dalseonensis]|uniref:Membrane dipeptidase n=1 Tax=Kaistia dalseonensis TaxID=410840 RepID=A0ABU0H302_9HYPH|nr:dipeptidase [Kaistia dalseonensis]MCX5493871.1 dipeptidase [Kaistia dalseonensis]MDQ0436437.1 membrane dipeptidase [Kaistia dalseonensis]